MIARIPTSAILLAIALSTASVGNAGPANRLPDEIRSLNPERIVQPLKSYKPVFPPDVDAEKDYAIVWVKVIINSKGKVRKADIVHCSNPGIGFEKAAWKTVRKSRFPKPTVDDTSHRDWLYTKVVFGNPPDPEPGSVMASEQVPTDRLPELIYKGRPEYPPRAISDLVEGRIMVEAVVGTDGLVISARILKSFDKAEKYGFHDAVLKAARECRFKPHLKNGKPIECKVSFPYEFKLSS